MAEPTRSVAPPELTHSLADSAATTGGDPTAAPPAAPLLTDRYTLGEEIARGGMGEVYRATDTVLNREVAVKVLQGQYAPDSGTAGRFADEARITGQLQHPNIPAVHDLGTLPDGRPFLAMKLIKGQTLDDLLKVRVSPAEDRGRFVAVFEQICQAVAYAHAHGVIHRDLKPANVMVGSFGEVQVMDWGLAKVLTSRDRQGAGDHDDPAATTPGTVVQSLRDSDGSFTQAGSVLGTPAFMPPEQAVGAVGKVDARSDVFGLGAVLAVILTGQPPFAGSSAETTRVKAATGDVADCLARLDGCGADPELVALCKKCLSPKREDRPADADVVAKAVAALRTAADERARQAELDKAETATRLAERRKRRRVFIGAAAALVGVVVLGSVGMAWQWWQAVAAGELAEQRRRDAVTAGELAEQRRREAEQARSMAEEDAAAASQVADYLGGLFDEADPFVISGRLIDPNANPNPTAADVVARGAKQLADPNFLKSRPLVRANLLDRLGKVYVGLGEGAKGFPLVMEALELRRKHLPPDHPDLAASLHNAGFLYFARWDYTKARDLFTQAMTIRAKLFGETSPPAVSSRTYLAATLVTALDDDAEPLLRRVLTEMKAARPAADPRGAAQIDFECCIVQMLAALHHSRREEKLKAGLAMADLLLTARAIPDKDLAALFPQVIEYEQLRIARRKREAAVAGRQVMTITERRLGKSHFLYLRFQLAYCHTLVYIGEPLEETEGVLKDVIAGFERAIGGGGGLAEALFMSGDWVMRERVSTAATADEKKRLLERAEGFFRRAVEEAKASGSMRQWGDYAFSITQFYQHNLPEPNLPQAERYAREALAAYRETKGVNSWDAGNPWRELILALARQQKLDELETTLRGFRSQLPDRAWVGGSDNWLRDVAGRLAKAERIDAALMYLDEAARVRPGILDEVDNDPQFAAVRQTDGYKQLREKVKPRPKK